MENVGRMLTGQGRLALADSSQRKYTFDSFSASFGSRCIQAHVRAKTGMMEKGLAERAGFEPASEGFPVKVSPHYSAYKAGAFSHSAISPNVEAGTRIELVHASLQGMCLSNLATRPSALHN